MATMTDEEREARIAEIELELRELVELMNEDADRMAVLLVDLKSRTAAVKRRIWADAEPA